MIAHDGGLVALRIAVSLGRDFDDACACELGC
jgi:hypothetical protein